MELTKDNYRLIGVKLYRNPILVEREFSKDLHLIHRVVKRLRIYKETGELKVNMLFNHYITACNCFGYDYVNKVALLLSNPCDYDLMMTWFNIVHKCNESLHINSNLIVEFDSSKLITPLINKVRDEFKLWE